MVEQGVIHMTVALVHVCWTGVLNSATNAERCAEQVAAQLRAGFDVSLDLSQVERMTPSFANTLIMRLLHEFPLSFLREHVQFHAPAAHVAEMLRRSVERFESGVRLSDQ